MSAFTSIFSWLGRFLKKVRSIVLDLGTALVVMFVVIAIIEALAASGPDVEDPSGKALLIDPAGMVVDQEVFNSESLLLNNH